MTPSQIRSLRAFVIGRARAYASGASYDSTTFAANDAAAHVGGTVSEVFSALEDLEQEGLVAWHRPASVPGYWTATPKAAREPLESV